VSEPLLPALAGAFGDGSGAVRVADDVVSWADLATRANALGRAMVGMAAVAIDATPTLDTVVAVAAALAAGCPRIPTRSPGWIRSSPDCPASGACCARRDIR
jgi:acyl-CoA synthetase (AMP-forming)/AMP-acid ligase II